MANPTKRNEQGNGTVANAHQKKQTKTRNPAEISYTRTSQLQNCVGTGAVGTPTLRKASSPSGAALGQHRGAHGKPCKGTPTKVILQSTSPCKHGTSEMVLGWKASHTFTPNAPGKFPESASDEQRQRADGTRHYRERPPHHARLKIAQTLQAH
ncbi:Hypothetical predicted protein [Pelobates cultripes]|uniref:Uncharacterized protein n=1 Tax=Pelobates cultripes TaxID=61616 RepID=A0AAD1TJ01_PELCU|nr:Hypothetical predicted protein [Pelobates cultripes]